MIRVQLDRGQVYFGLSRLKCDVAMNAFGRRIIADAAIDCGISLGLDLLPDLLWDEGESSERARREVDVWSFERCPAGVRFPVEGAINGPIAAVQLALAGNRQLLNRWDIYWSSCPATQQQSWVPRGPGEHDTKRGTTMHLLSQVRAVN